MKDIRLSPEELKLLVSFLATAETSLSRFVALSRNEEKEMFTLLVGEKKLIANLLEKLLKK